MSIKRSKQAKKLAPKKKRVSARKQAEQVVVPSPLNGVVAPINKRFGQPEGNPRHHGAWKKEDTLRFKLQQIAKMSEEEIKAGLEDETLGWGAYEKQIGKTILDLRQVVEPEKRLHALAELTNQDSGMPKQQVDQTNYEAPIPLSPREIITEPQAKPTQTTKKKK